jgi:hypothetical protein
MSKIFIIRGMKVMFDKDLAALYGVTTGNFNKAIQRNLRRFPPDFMFQLSKEEYDNLIFQFGTSRWGGTRKLPYCFTEQGVAMLSGVLNSDRAIEVNIRVIRIFVLMRELLLTHKDILLKLDTMEQQVVRNSDDISMIFEALRQLLNPQQPPAKPIGFRRKNERS